MQFDKRLICVTGLPRAGSTLLCQLLAHHPEIYCHGHTSPLPAALGRLRQQLSENEFLLAQLDVHGDLVHQRLVNAFRGLMQGWFAETDRPCVVDKNRSWSDHIELANLCAPDFRMLFCVRDPVQVYGSIEAAHQRTLLLDSADSSAHLSPYDRAIRLFARDGVAGVPMRSFQAMQDHPETLHKRLYVVVFERLVADPVAVIGEIFDFIGLPRIAIDPNNLTTLPSESDSHYRLKYRHRTHRSIHPPEKHVVPARIEQEIRKSFAWFYDIFYPQAR